MVHIGVLLSLAFCVAKSSLAMAENGGSKDSQQTKRLKLSIFLSSTMYKYLVNIRQNQKQVSPKLLFLMKQCVL